MGTLVKYWRRRRSARTIAYALSGLSLIILPIEVFPMAKMCLFSEVRGEVVLHGKPVVGAAIEREVFWLWKNERIKDSTITSEKGEFLLPAVIRSSILGSLLPHEPVIEQRIVITVGGTRYQGWGHIKSNYEINGETNGAPISLSCDIASDPIKRGKVFGMCKLR